LDNHPRFIPTVCFTKRIRHFPLNGSNWISADGARRLPQRRPSLTRTSSARLRGSLKRRVASDTIVYSELRDYAKAGTVLDRVLAFKPDDTDVRFARAWLDIDWKADTRPLHALVETILNW